MHLERENDEALKRFSKRWGSIARDEDLAQVGIKKLGDEIADDLRGIGVKDEAIAPLRGSPEHLIKAHAALRMQGHKMRSPDELLDRVGRQLGEKFRIAPTARTRQEIVRAARTARGFANRDDDISTVRPAASPAEQADLAKRREQLNRMRQDRGFDSY
jgi:hypothetical protein